MSNAFSDNASEQLPLMAMETREDVNGLALANTNQYSGMMNGENIQSDPELLLEDGLKESTRTMGEKLLTQAKKEFHSKRYLILKNVPEDATQESIRLALEKHLEIKEVTFNQSLQTAKVNLVKPELLESWSLEELQIEIENHMVTVWPSDTDGMLCVAHLPFIYTEDDFRNLVQMYGPVATCFLFRSEKTGDHKGYGFVEYSSRDVAYKAKPLLEQKTLGDCQLKCCWLDPSHLTYNSLHSKCLFVDHLPIGFRDMVEFRKIFSAISSPSYCQIGMKNGQSLGFGLVEFDNADDAEETQKLLNHSKLDDHQIRVTFCAPGNRAMVIYNKLISGLISSVKQPLLPDPPRNGMASMPTTPLYQSQANGVGNNRSWETNRLSNGNYNDSQVPLNTGTSNSSLQEAVILLLAAQVQSQLGMQQSALLSNPQTLSLILQAVIGQQVNATETQEMTETLKNILLLLQQTNGQNRCQVSNGNANLSNNGSGQWHPPKTSDGKAYNKVPLLPDPPCVKLMDSGGLLPTPSKLNLNSFCNGQGNFMNSALTNGNQQPLFVKTQPEIVSKLPYDSQGRQKVPLLGDKPPNVPLSGPNSTQSMDRSGFSLLNSTNSFDTNALSQLLAPLIVKNSQLLQNAKFPKMNENFAFQQSKNGNSVQGVPPAVMNLLLQSIQRVQQQQGELKTGTVPNHNGFQFPLNVSYSSPNLFLGTSPMASKQLLFGNAAMVSPPAAHPPPTPGPRPSHVLTMSPPGAAKHVFTQPFLFQSQSQNGLHAGSLAAAQLMAEIQQRGSLLGDFWQTRHTLNGAHLTNHFANGKLPAPLIANVGYPTITKRKHAFPEMTSLSDTSPVDQQKKRRI